MKRGLSAEDKELSLVPDDHLLDPLVYRRVPRLNILAGALARRSNYSNCDNMMVQEGAFASPAIEQCFHNTHFAQSDDEAAHAEFIEKVNTITTR
eukprot:8925132-Prorocentrum_lima.AAC.1